MAETTIIPIAGGKGGVGKTFLSANLAMALAQQGHRTIAVDLDLGNSNLHTLLGLENRSPGIGEFLRSGSKATLREMVVATGVKNLGFLAGDGWMPFMANITYNQKRKVLRELKRLDARYVLLDLSAGTSFTTLDFFLLGTSGMLVTTPEYPSIVSMLVFLKNLVLRAIERQLGRELAADRLAEMYNQPMDARRFTIATFVRDVEAESPETAERIRVVCRSLRPRIVYNMVDRANDSQIFARIDRTLEQELSLACEHLGLIPYDARVREANRSPGAFLAKEAESPAAQAVQRTAARILKYWDREIDASAQRLAASARQLFAEGG
jgi:flagellar biosynthesis protein FlhG